MEMSVIRGRRPLLCLNLGVQYVVEQVHFRNLVIECNMALREWREH